MPNRDLAGTRYSPLKQITAGNVATLSRAIDMCRAQAAPSVLQMRVYGARAFQLATKGDRELAKELTIGTFHALGLQILRTERKALGLPRGLNNQWNKGGLQYALPFR